MALFSSLADRLRMLLPPRYRAKHPLVPVVRLSGAIGAALPLRPGLSVSSCAPALERAFGMPGIKAVALVVNSPGGSAVQSHLIYKRIRAHAEEKKVPVFVFVEDVAASGGYMIACAGEEIFADPSSLVGSIGVIFAGFGFERLIERFGVERRVHTAGRNKAMLDPFRPERPEDVERLKEIQARVHATFRGLVESRRGARLKGEPENLFSGEVWAGPEALEHGLIDGLGDVRAVMRERFGDKVRLPVIPTEQPSLLARWFGRSGSPQATFGSPQALVDPTAVIAAIEERAAWARWGL
jgi:signal peptide peptidase SppA